LMSHWRGPWCTSWPLRRRCCCPALGRACAPCAVSLGFVQGSPHTIDCVLYCFSAPSPPPPPPPPALALPPLSSTPDPIPHPPSPSLYPCAQCGWRRGGFYFHVACRLVGCSFVVLRVCVVSLQLLVAAAPPLRVSSGALRGMEAKGGEGKCAPNHRTGPQRGKGYLQHKCGVSDVTQMCAAADVIISRHAKGAAWRGLVVRREGWQQGQFNVLARSP
jgi:hypothetical protein